MLLFCLHFHRHNLSRFLMPSSSSALAVHPPVASDAIKKRSGLIFSSTLHRDESFFLWCCLFIFEHFDNVSGSGFLSVYYLELSFWLCRSSTSLNISFLVLSSWYFSLCFSVWGTMSHISLNTPLFSHIFIIKLPHNL